MSWTPVEPGSTTLDAVADQGLTGRNVWSPWWGAPHLEFRHQGIIKTPTGVSDDSGQSAAITSFPQLGGLSWCQTAAAERDYNVATGETPARGVKPHVRQSPMD